MKQKTKKESRFKLKLPKFGPCFKKVKQIAKWTIALGLAVTLLSTFVVYKVETEVFDRKLASVKYGLLSKTPFPMDYIQLMGWTGVITSKMDWEQSLYTYASSPSCRAVIIQLESPGGYATPSVEMARAVDKFKKKYPDKLIMFYTQTVLASGAYLIASSGNGIVATPGALIGSIGVIWEHTDISGLLGKIGVKITPYTTGKHKAMFGYGEPDPEEKQMLHDILDETFGVFKENVLFHRAERIRNATSNFDSTWNIITDGRIFTTKQAYDCGLIDNVVFELDMLIATVKMGLEKQGYSNVLVLTGFQEYKNSVNFIYNETAVTKAWTKVLEFLSFNPTSANAMMIWRP